MPVTKSLDLAFKDLNTVAKSIKVEASVALTLSTPILSPYKDAEKLLPIKSVKPWLGYFVYAYVKIAYPNHVKHFSIEAIQSLRISISGRQSFKMDGEPFTYLNGSDYRHAFKLQQGKSINCTASIIVNTQAQEAVKSILGFALESFWLWFSTGLVKSKGFGQFVPSKIPANAVLALLKEACQIGHLVTYAKHKCLGEEGVNHEHQVEAICNKLDDLIKENFGRGSNGFLVIKSRAPHKVFVKQSKVRFSYNAPKTSNKYLESILKERMLIKPDERTKDGRVFLSLLREYLKSKKLPDDIKPFLVRNGRDLGVSDRPLYALGNEDRFEESWEGEELDNTYANQDLQGRNLFYRALFGMPENLEYLIASAPYMTSFNDQWGTVKFTFESEMEQLESAVQYKSILGNMYVIGYPNEVYLPKNQEVKVLYQICKGKSSKYPDKPRNWKYGPIMLPDPDNLQGFGVYSFMSFLEKRNYLK